jgi:hypothetical protein
MGIIFPKVVFAEGMHQVVLVLALALFPSMIKMRISFCTTGSTVYDSSDRILGRRLRFCRGLLSQV